MPISRLLACLGLCGALSHAAQVKFLPDTVCAGNKGNCTVSTTKVLATGTKSILIRPYYLLSPSSAGTEFEFQTKALPAMTVWNTLEPRGGTSKWFRFAVRARDTRRDTIRVDPRDTVSFTQFRFGSCFYCVSIAARAADSPAHLGNGERVGILFGTDSTHLDTLWVIANQWFSGGTLPPRPATGQILSYPPRDALGRRWSTGTAATIEFTPVGAQLPEKP